MPREFLKPKKRREWRSKAERIPVSRRMAKEDRHVTKQVLRGVAETECAGLESGSKWNLSMN